MGKRRERRSRDKQPVCAFCGEYLDKVPPGFDLDKIVIESCRLPRGLDLHHVIIRQLREAFHLDVSLGRLNAQQLDFAGHRIDSNLMVVVHQYCHKLFNQELNYAFTYDPEEGESDIEWFLRRFPSFGLFSLAGRGNHPNLRYCWIPATRARPHRESLIDQAIEDDIAFKSFS